MATKIKYTVQWGTGFEQKGMTKSEAIAMARDLMDRYDYVGLKKE